MEKIMGYCVKCRCMSEMKEGKEKKTSNGRTMMQGPCKKCGTTISKFMAGAKKEKDDKKEKEDKEDKKDKKEGK